MKIIGFGQAKLKLAKQQSLQEKVEEDIEQKITSFR